MLKASQPSNYTEEAKNKTLLIIVAKEKLKICLHFWKNKLNSKKVLSQQSQKSKIYDNY